MENEQLYPAPHAAPVYQPYQGGLPLQPMNPAQASAPPAPQEVVYHQDNRSSSRNDNDNDSDDDEPEAEMDQKSPGDVPQRYLNLEFKATFHEHNKTALFKPVQKVLGIIYRWIKLIIYHFFVFIVGIPLLIIWAILNGIMAFIYSWLWSPALRITIFWLAAVLPLVTMPLVSIFRPLIDVSARCLRQIRVKGDLTGKGFVQNV